MIGDLIVVAVLAAAVALTRVVAAAYGRRVSRRLAEERADWAEWCVYRDAIRGGVPR